MAEPIRPASTKTFTKENWIFVPTIASSTLAPTVAEATGATSLDISRIIFASSGRPTATTNRVTAERRLADGAQYEQIGTTTWTGGEMLYAMGDQATAATDPKKLYEKIPDGTTGFLVNRRGLGRAVDVAAGQFVNVYPVEFGPSVPVNAGENETAEAAMSVTFAVTGPPALIVAVLA
jgi:hypothetical protein